MTSKRPSADVVFMEMARAAARRSTCPRAHVGCVLVAGPDVLATGYNGAPKGADHCCEVGCWMVDGHCKRALHAELNAALRLGGRKADTAYVTHLPCVHCVQALHLAGVLRVVFGAPYRADFETMANLTKIYGIQFQQEPSR